MKNFLSILAFLLTFTFPYLSQAQISENTGAIEMVAIFKEVIQLNVNHTDKASPKVEFTVDEIDEYRNGIISDDQIMLSVASSTHYTVAMKVEQAHFTSPNNSFKLDSDNFGLTLSAKGNYEESDKVKTAQGVLLLGTGGQIVKGSAGDHDDNNFLMQFQLGTSTVREKQNTKKGTLLSQNIPPATYTNTIVLTASSIY